MEPQRINIDVVKKPQSRLQQNFGKWDNVFSRYFHEIELLDSGKILKGYSKGMNLPAPTDAHKELMDTITRVVVNNKYLSKSKSITWYVNDLDPEKQLGIVTLYADKFVLSHYYFDDMKLKTYLDKLYEFLLKGIKPEYLRPKFKPNGKVDPFPMAFTIKTMDKFHNYCNWLLANGHNKAVVEDYYRKYKSEHEHKMTRN